MKEDQVVYVDVVVVKSELKFLCMESWKLWEMDLIL